jgi:hypothetical protein
MRSPWDSARLVGGLILQPFLAAGLAFVLFPVLLLDREGRTLAGGYPSDPTDGAVAIAFGAGIVATVVTFLGVLPTAARIMRRRQLTLRETLLFGWGFGILPYVLLSVAGGGRTYGPFGLLRGLALSSVLGLVGAAVFWIVALRPGIVPRGEGVD